MLSWFLLYKNVNQSYKYIYLLSLELPTSPPSHPSRSSESSRLSSLCYIVTSYWLSVSCMVVCMFTYYSLSLSHPLPHCVHNSVLSLYLYSCPENRFISTIFLDFIYIYIYIYIYVYALMYHIFCSISDLLHSV